MAASITFVARTETGTVTRSSSTRVYAYAVLIKSPRIPSWQEGHDPADLTEGAWGWSGDRVNAAKMARDAQRGWPSSTVRVVPVLQVAKTEPAACQGMPDMRWHAVDLDGNVVRYGSTKANVVELIGKTRRAADSRVAL